MKISLYIYFVIVKGGDNMIINVENLSKLYKVKEIEPGLKNTIKSIFNSKKRVVKAIDNFNMEVYEGDIIGLIGANGAGKTTLIKMLCGILYPTNGQISVLGENPFERSNKFKRSITLVSGNKQQLSWDLSPMESFILTKHIYEINESDFNKELKYLSNLFQVNSILNKPVRNLSLGQRMKCEIINSILHNPKIIFLDEPTLGLDLIAQKNIRNLIKTYAESRNASIILTSHYIDDILFTANRIIIINSGVKIIDCKLKDFLADNQLSKKIIINYDFEIDNLNFDNWEKYIIKKEKFQVIMQVPSKEINELLKFLGDNKVKISDLNIEDIEVSSCIESFIK